MNFAQRNWRSADPIRRVSWAKVGIVATCLFAGQVAADQNACISLDELSAAGNLEMVETNSIPCSQDAATQLALELPRIFGTPKRLGTPTDSDHEYFLLSRQALFSLLELDDREDAIALFKASLWRMLRDENPDFDKIQLWYAFQLLSLEDRETVLEKALHDVIVFELELGGTRLTEADLKCAVFAENPNFTLKEVLESAAFGRCFKKSQ